MVDLIKKKLSKSYKETLRGNFVDINDILIEFNIDKSKLFPVCRYLLESSSDNIVNKWLTKKKYVRTAFVLRAFSKSYPLNGLKKSLMIDAMVNILDDLLDEKLSQDDKKLYVLEYLRVFSNFLSTCPDKYILKALGKYINRLITLAIAEFEFLNFISKEKNRRKIIDLSFKLLSLRSQDIDIFVQIPMHLDKGLKSEKLLKNFRIFRVVNLLKKDLADIDHDKQNNQETLVTYMLKRKDYEFKGFISDLKERFKIEHEKVLSRYQDKNASDIVQRLNKMFEEELLEIDNLIF